MSFKRCLAEQNGLSTDDVGVQEEYLKERLLVTREDIMAAFRQVRPSAMREVSIDVPKVGIVFNGISVWSWRMMVCRLKRPVCGIRFLITDGPRSIFAKPWIPSAREQTAIQRIGRVNIFVAQLKTCYFPSSRRIFNLVSLVIKACVGSVLLRSVIDPENTRHHQTQNEHQLRLGYSRFPGLRTICLFFFVVVGITIGSSLYCPFTFSGRCKYFDVGFTALNRNSQKNLLTKRTLPF